MYDFYPEWGPARNRDEDQPGTMTSDRYWSPPAPSMATAGAPQPRDAHGERPDDN